MGGLSVSPSAANLEAAGPSRTVTGVLSSKPMSRDIKIDSFSMGLNGVELIQVGLPLAAGDWMVHKRAPVLSMTAHVVHATALAA